MSNRRTKHAWNVWLLLGAGVLAACSGPRTIHLGAMSEIVVEKKSIPSKATASPEPKLTPTWSEDRPVTIISDKMTYLNEGEITIFEGHVHVTQDGLELRAPYLKVSSSSGRALARNGVELTDHIQDAVIQARELDYQHDLSHVTARQQVHLITKDDTGNVIKLNSDQLDWQPNSGNGRAQGQVVVYYKAVTATAGIMTFSDQEKKIVLQPDPQKTQVQPLVLNKDDRITGRQITLLMNNNTYIVTGKAQALVNPNQDGKQRGLKDEGTTKP